MEHDDAAAYEAPPFGSSDGGVPISLGDDEGLFGGSGGIHDQGFGDNSGNASQFPFGHDAVSDSPLPTETGFDSFSMTADGGCQQASNDPIPSEAASVSSSANNVSTTTTAPSVPVFTVSSAHHSDSSPSSVAAGTKEKRCKHCLERIEEMKASQGAVYKKGASLFEENWAKAGTPCFGLCDTPLACVEHGYPLHECFRRHYTSKTIGTGTGDALIKHTVCVYRARWVVQKRHEFQHATDPVPDLASFESKLDLTDLLSTNGFYAQSPMVGSSSDGSPSGPQVSPGTPSDCAAVPAFHNGDCVAELKQRGISGISHDGQITFPCDCFNRLVLLAAAPWVTNNPQNSALLRRYIVESVISCTGFCKTPYCCRIHLCPAEQVPGHGSRYQCQRGSHDNSDNRGRHHADFCYYCGDPECCGGKWYSRDQSHKRAKETAAKEKEKGKVKKEDSEEDDSEQSLEMKEVRKRPEKRCRNATESSAPNADSFPEDEYEYRDSDAAVVSVERADLDAPTNVPLSSDSGSSPVWDSVNRMVGSLLISGEEMQQEGPLRFCFRCFNSKIVLWISHICFFVLFVVLAVITAVALTRECEDDCDCDCENDRD